MLNLMLIKSFFSKYVAIYVDKVIDDIGFLQRLPSLVSMQQLSDIIYHLRSPGEHVATEFPHIFFLRAEIDTYQPALESGKKIN